MNKYFFICIFVFSGFFSSCLQQAQPPPIGNSNMSFPGALTAFNSNNFLLLNTDANGDYSDGSIMQYSVDGTGNFVLQNAVSISPHGSELAVSSDTRLVALSFDTSQSPTVVNFYNYSNPQAPVLLSNLTLTLNQAGGKQSVKNIRFFSPGSGGNFYYLYGAILNFPQDDGTSKNFPTRTFVARIAKDFSSSQVLFYLSFGVNDPNSLAAKSNSLNPDVLNTPQYMLGFSSPTFDATHNLLIAFPTGSMNGFNNQSVNIYPSLPDALTYFSGQPNGNTNACNFSPCIQPDFRAISLAAVDFNAILSGNPLNNSTYFVPLGWNNNGIPYAAQTNNTNIVFPSISGNSNSTSFTYQTGFWSSYWANTNNLGNNNTSCFIPNAVTTQSNQYQLIGDNGLLVGKNGPNGGGDNGNGNEVFQITGLDILSQNIAQIKAARGGINPAGELDFNKIAQVQTIDPYNTYYSTIKSIWFAGSSGTLNAGPLVPYMYSRTTNVSGFNSTPTSVLDFGVLNFGSNSCRPYWARDTYGGIGSYGTDSAWVGATPVPITAGSNNTYPNAATVDPTQPANYAFSWGSGAQRCDSVTPTTNTPYIFCVNFLTSAITRFSTTATAPVFNPF